MQCVRVVLQIIIRAPSGDDTVSLLHQLDNKLALLTEDIVRVFILGTGEHRENLVEDVLLPELGLFRSRDKGLRDQELVGDMGDQFLVIELVVHCFGNSASHFISAAAVFTADRDNIFHWCLPLSS